ncbi:UDP-glucose flavonoid 3-O-glucosyltransferase 7 [Rhizoctonia solani]|uniref:UDP-glucose flavonoid 3-O-glucosyltransferase 7 n=1 Tax=Rhizoctonia solani TaxID=456999 RepID=A0A0K6FZP9_9AGAM|nr:UDP-glucose flavonoid 3-O-glucosyltransferase 7 [Rhizoctonia solani]
MTFTPLKHIVFLPAPPWGHLRPGLKTSLRMVEKFPDIFISLFVYHTEVPRAVKYLSSQPSSYSRRVRIVTASSSDVLPPVDADNMVELLLYLEQSFKSWITNEFQEPTIVQVESQPVNTPSVIIEDVFNGGMSLACRDVHGLPTVGWWSTTAASTMIVVEHRASGPGIYDKLASLPAQDGVDLFEKAGQLYLQEVCDRLVRTPGLPPFHEWELNPQYLPFIPPFMAFMNPRVSKILNHVDKIVFCTTFEMEPISATSISTAFKNPITPFCIGPQVDLTSPHQPDSESPVTQFLDRAYTENGAHSVIYAAFGTAFFPLPESVSKLMVVLDEMPKAGFRFIFALSSPNAQIDKSWMDAHVQAGNAIFPEWTNQTAVLEHPAIHYFLSHGGWNSSTEALVRGVPMIFWPFIGDQPTNSLRIATIHDCGFELLQVRAGPAQSKAYRNGAEVEIVARFLPDDRLVYCKSSEGLNGAEQHDATRSPVDDEEDAPIDSTYSGPPQRKRRALGGDPRPNTAKPLNKIKGKLSGVFSLPVEVFMEIVQHLPLPDVLSLSRSNKFFHQMLTTRSAATLHVWHAAIANVPGLPPCPKDLCEPQYATLLYSKHCTMCGTSVVRPMDPYLNIRLCKDCTEIHVAHANEIPDEIRALVPQSEITYMKATRYGMKTCLVRDKTGLEAWFDKLEAAKQDGSMTQQARLSEIDNKFSPILERLKYATKMEYFLRNMAKVRSKQIDQLKEQRRQEYVSHTTWQKIYPSLVPYLEKNRTSQNERSKIIHKGKRLRRMRRLLLAIRNSNNLFEGDEDDLSGEENASGDASGATTADDLIASEDEPGSIVDGESDHESDIEPPNHSTPIVTPIRLQMTFPPMVDPLEWPIISDLLKLDVDADTMQARFEELKDEIEDQIRSWGSTVEDGLAAILKTGRADDGARDPEDGLDSDLLQLEMKDPSKSALMDRLTPTTRLLLRADSVFRVSEDTIAPLPLYFPEMFTILQDRSDGYCPIAFRNLGFDPPWHGHTWDPNEVVYYPEGSIAAKALLRQLGRVDAAQFELQALGGRFTCGCCGDNWVRSWNEMVQHYAETIVHANMAKKANNSVKEQVKYNNIHALDLGTKIKGKRKSIVILHSIEDAKALSLQRRQWENQVRCNMCEQLDIDFRSPRDVMLKHVRTVHSIKAPKAEHYTRMTNMRGHPRIDDPMECLSDSTEATDPEIVNVIISTPNYGPAVFWSYYGPHSCIHPGWDRQDF